MPIVTDFRFNQIRDDENVRRLSLHKTDLLGPLRHFIGHNHTRTWSGTGFNLIWRPHDKSAPNTEDFFLELDITKETLSFTDITGPQGIANRGLLQGDIALGGLAYQQEVSDIGRKPSKPLHFEPGVWLSVPLTRDPSEPATIARMGSIPHGTTVNAQGKAFSSSNGQPKFTPASIMPFSIDSNDDGLTNIFSFSEGTTPLATTLSARSPASDVPGLTDAHFQDPSKILSDFVKSQKIVRTMVFEISTNLAAPGLPQNPQSPNPGDPKEGGGVGNIGFLVGAANGPNANAAQMTATFWVEEVEEPNGKTFMQLQYIQRVFLNFKNLTWPHISVATMTVKAES